MNNYLLDTNILMNNKVNSGYVIYPVLKELDKLKTAEGATGKEARDAIFRIYTDPESFPFIYEENEENETVDDFLIRYAQKANLVLVTLDLSLHLKAKAQNLHTIFPMNGSNGSYTGITYLDDAEYIGVLSGDYDDEFPENHFLVYHNEAFQILEGIPRKIGYQHFKNSYVGNIKPKNIEQYCLTELLLSEIPVIVASGTWGSGKSYLLLNYALMELEKGHIDRIIVVPNNSFVSDSREIAAVPGGLLEKEFMHLGPLIDLVGKIQIEQMVQHGQVEVLPISIARGRNLSNAIIWTNESQNLTEEHVKLLLGRVAEGTRIFFDGDIRQTDKKVFEMKSGLKLLSKLAETDRAYMFGSVKLISVERSETAQLADLLDTL